MPPAFQADLGPLSTRPAYSNLEASHYLDIYTLVPNQSQTLNRFDYRIKVDREFCYLQVQKYIDVPPNFVDTAQVIYGNKPGVLF